MIHLCHAVADAGGRGLEVLAVTVLFRIRIDGEIHEVRVEVPPDRSSRDLESLKKFVLTTAYLEHYGRLPKGVVNAFD